MSVLLHFNKLLTKPNQKQIRYAQNDRLRLSFDGTIREHDGSKNGRMGQVVWFFPADGGRIG